jgi:hypothetical protein
MARLATPPVRAISTVDDEHVETVAGAECEDGAGDE